MTMMGPKDSSLARYMWSSTPVNTVGSMKKPVRKNKGVTNRRNGSSPQFLRWLYYKNLKRVKVENPLNKINIPMLPSWTCYFPH